MTSSLSQALASISIDDIRDARERIASTAIRTPLIRLHVDSPAEIYLKLETLQPIGSFKLRGATNAIGMLSRAAMGDGVYTASAGNMAQGVAWGARALGVACTVIMPDSAPATKVEAVRRLGADIVFLSYDEWWATLVNHGRECMRGAFIHPVADRAVMAGNGTIGLEIAEDLPDADAVMVPFGGGGLVSGIATAVRALMPRAKVYACEVSTSTPLTAAYAAGEPVVVERLPSFVDGIGGRGVLPEMWEIVRQRTDGPVVAQVDDVKSAIRMLVERARIVAEGAGATPVAAALAGKGGTGKVVCVVSGGNIDTKMLTEILG
jgi:threonine dehydratase